MTITQLKSFLEVSKQSSITGAASKIYVSQPALSRQIMNMEKELGFILFERNGNNLKLTKAGEAFLAGVERTCEEYDRACHRASLIADGMLGTLHIGVLEDQVVDLRLNQAVKLFHKEYPEIYFELRWLNFDLLHRGMMDGTVDLALTFKHNEESCPNIQYLTSEPQDMYLCITKDYSYPENAPIYTQSLPRLSRQYPFIALLPERFEQGSRLTNTVRYNPTHETDEDSVQTVFVDSTSQRALYVSTGLGFAVVTRSSQVLSSPGIRTIPIPDCPPVERVLCYNRTIENPVRELFCRFLQNMPNE